MKSFLIAIPVLMMIGLTACQTSSKMTTEERTPTPQVVTFDDSEVPYIAVSKKNGKVSAEIVSVPAQASQVTVK